MLEVGKVRKVLLQPSTSVEVLFGPSFERYGQGRQRWACWAEERTYTKVWWQSQTQKDTSEVTRFLLGGKGVEGKLDVGGGDCGQNVRGLQVRLSGRERPARGG